MDEFILWYVAKQERIPFDKRKAKGTIKNYKKIYRRLKRYYTTKKKRIYLSTLSMDDVDECVAWFEDQRQKDGSYYAQNTVRGHEKWLISLANKALANRFECPLWNPKQSEGRVSEASSDDIHFTLDDLSKLITYTPKSAMETNALVWSIVGYCNRLRFSDWQRAYTLLSGEETDFGESCSTIEIQGKNYRFLKMCPEKTRKHNSGKGIWCGIPILKPVEDIIQKYGLPKPMVNQLMNKMLKEVAVNAGINEMYYKKTKLAGGRVKVEKAVKGEFMSSHKVGRVSFITTFSELIPKPILVKITGHVSSG